jgi:RNA recognition motif-containing protein
MTIYIGNLSYKVVEEDLKSVFEDYGSVKRVVLPSDRETGRMRGFAFVEMLDDESEDKAIKSLDGADWMGRSLKVNKARPKENIDEKRDSIGQRVLEIRRKRETASRIRQVPKNLILTIEVNKNSSVDEVALEISNLCKAINAYHISCGGTGLAIGDWEIQVLSRELVGV